MRGEYNRDNRCKKCRNRFISTCVENIGAIRRSLCLKPVHLHVRGEYAGKLFLIFRGIRFISTCVENMPRSTASGRSVNGSSPRAWRILTARLSACGITRFISTCVENMVRVYAPVVKRAVHLHVRGEYFDSSRRTEKKRVHLHVRGEYVDFFREFL